MDSILKNVGGEYCRLFGQQLLEIFLHAYQLVNPDEKSKLFKVFQTWETYSKPLFSPQLLQELGQKVGFFNIADTLVSSDRS